MTAGLVTQRISPQAYNALAEALAVIFWNKDPFARYIRTALSGHPELLARVDFTATKRTVASCVVAMLQERPACHSTALQLIVDIAEMQAFPNLASQTDAQHLVGAAQAAVAELRRITARYREQLDERERVAARAAAEQQERAARQLMSATVAQLRSDFLDLHQHPSPQERGRVFEQLLYRLFAAYDLQPRLAYDLAHEQIDGAFTFDTDDYLLEAKWWAKPVDREQADAFAAKILRKGRNTLGLFVAVNGFTEGFLNTPQHGGMPFIAMDGDDLFHVLDGRVELVELLRIKKRHLNETGRCLLRARGLAALT